MNDMTPSEPNLGDILAAIHGLKDDLGRVEAKTDHFRTDVTHRLDRLDAKTDQLRADVAAVKVDTSYTEAHIGDIHEAVRRHLVDPNAHGGREAA